MNRREQAEAYREQMGNDAFLRQAVTAEHTYPCCGESRTIGHHPDCKYHPQRKAERAYRKVSEQC